MKVLHILPRFIGGGPERHVLALAELWRQAGHATQHTLAVLEPPLSAPFVLKARKAGVSILRERGLDPLLAAIEAADIVAIQFWNHPQLYELLREELPPMRAMVSAVVSGLSPPQILPAELGHFADSMRITASSADSAAARRAREAGRPVIVSPSLADMSRLAGFSPRQHPGIRVGYLGLVEPTKMHPRFAALCSKVTGDHVSFHVFGDGSWGDALALQFAELGARHRITFHGHAEDLCEAFAEIDIFGYPLAPDTYASSDKTIQEAMWAGIPPVVLAGTGVSELISHERTGLVCRNEDEYPAAIDRLANDHALRRQLGDAARAHARNHFDPARNAADLWFHFTETARLPKRSRAPLPGRTLSAAARFVASLGEKAGPFALSLSGTPRHTPEAVKTADLEIGMSSAVLAQGEGGVIHYRNTYPDDALLRLWAGLIFRQAKNLAKARAEFDAAIALGVAPSRTMDEEACSEHSS